jgi:predicted flavoprotein YhiN
MKKSQPYLDIANMLDGVVGNKLGIYILSDYLGYDILKKISSLDNSDFRKITSALKNLTFNHLKKGTYKQSQTTMGGVDASCVDNNLQIINHSGLFVCGEACDINGICGGYNLTWAFISAMLADDKILMDF